MKNIITLSKILICIIVSVILSFFIASCDDEKADRQENFYAIDGKKSSLPGLYWSPTEEIEDAIGTTVYKTHFTFYGKGIKKVKDEHGQSTLEGDGERISLFLMSPTPWPSAGDYTPISDEDTPGVFNYQKSEIYFATENNQLEFGEFVDGPITVSFPEHSCVLDFSGFINSDIDDDGIFENYSVTFHFELGSFQGTPP